MKYVKWAYGLMSNQDGTEYKLDEVNEANNWNQQGGFDGMGGFNFTNEENALRWSTRGDTLYDVIIPEDASVINVPNQKTPNGIIRSNKIILTNPQPLTDELMMSFLEKSNMPSAAYYESIAACAMHNCRKTALKLINEKVNENNIDEVLDSYNTFIQPWHEGYINEDCWNYVLEILNEIKSPLDISVSVSKPPYIKELTNDKIINLTGQSGSGKSYYAIENFNTPEYLIIDTDDILSGIRFSKSTGINKELGEYFRNKYKTLPNLSDDFDLIYNDILDYCSNINKTIVIDCAQFHCCKDISILKGKIIIIRTDITTCYERTINRWIANHNIYEDSELENYKERKKSIFKWYKGTNEFIHKIEEVTKDK